MITKRLIAFFLVLALFPAMLTIPAAALETDNQESNSYPPISALSTCAQQIADMSGEIRTVATLKELRDYADNVYYVCELDPIGYIIADASYGTILEYSPSAPSPYLDVDEDLVYLGPTYCYARQCDGTLNDLFSGDIIAADDEAFINSAREASEQLHAAQAEYTRTTEQLNTVDGSQSSNLIGFVFSPNAGTTAVNEKFITGGKNLRKLKTEQQIGYMEGGVCGYIAAGLMLYWIDECFGAENAVNDFAFLQKDCNGFWGTGLTRELHSYGSMNGSSAIDIPFYAEDISDVIDEYAKEHSLKIDYNRDIAVFHTLTSVMDWLEEHDKPVILFGNLNDPKSSNNKIQHAVLAYGWTENSAGENQEIVAHYGWENCSEVIIQKAISTFGSSVKFENIESKVVPMTDVNRTNSYSWAYDAAQYCGRYQIIPISNKEFLPSKKVSRGEFVNALYTLTGRPRLKTGTDASVVLKPYTDINKDSPYYMAAAWAVQNHIMTGTSTSTLGLDRILTREQTAVFFMAYSKVLGLSFSSINGPAASSFNDYNKVSDWAKEGMNYCTRRYLLSGVGGNLLSPSNKLTRAQIAVIMYECTKKATR